MNEVDILNKIEQKAFNGKATIKELNLLIEAYHIYNIRIPTEIKEIYFKNDK